MKRGEGVDQPSQERAPPACLPPSSLGEQYPAGEQKHAIPPQHPAEEHHRVVGRNQPPGQLNRQGAQPVERVERMKIEGDPGGRVEQVDSQRVAQPVHQRLFDPPKIPVVLPAVKPIARNGVGQVQRQRPGEHNRQQQIEDKRCQMADPEMADPDPGQGRAGQHTPGRSRRQHGQLLAARSAARNKFSISMTLVIGPVPPGTGVNRLACSATPTWSQSPLSPASV